MNFDEDVPLNPIHSIMSDTLSEILMLVDIRPIEYGFQLSCCIGELKRDQS